MSEDNRPSSGSSSDASSSGDTMMGETSSSSSLYSQAIRFLISLKSQKNQDREAQKNFLISKGLSEQEIEKAFEEIKKPNAIAKDGLVSVNQNNTESLSDEEAFDLAAKAFDDPLHSAATTTITQQSSTAPFTPPRTYPKSPLALYQQQQQQAAAQGMAYGAGQTSSSSSIDNPLTRYHVILRFLRSLCYFLVLGGGLTSIAVAIYRAYLMPRLMKTLDARSNLLQHHKELFFNLTNKVQNLKKNSLAPSSSSQQQPSTLKGVLKKVQFADEVQEKSIGEEDEKTALLSNNEEEEKKESGDKDISSEKEKLAVSEVKSGEESNKEGEEKEEEKSEKPAIVPIDILEPLRGDLARLSQVLKADISGSAVGTEIGSEKKELSTATTVEEEGEDGWVSDEDSDELEFDPFATPSPNSNKSSKRKHSPKTSGSAFRSSNAGNADLSSSSSSSSAATLKSTLNNMNAYINTQTYMANSNVFGTKSYGFTSIGNTSSNAADSSSKSGEVAQIRAEIRSLKGLLLSRRNFPIYNRTIQPQS